MVFAKTWVCTECSRRLSNNNNWCFHCKQRQFKEKFNIWTSEDKAIDELIQETQLKAKNCTDFLEWLPFESFIGINRYDEAETGVVYTANWKKGPIDTWDENEGKFIQKRDLVKVALVSYGNNASIFFKELKLHYNARKHNGLMVRIFGATRESITGNYMMVAETVEWDVRHYTSHHFSHLTWSRKLGILYSIASAVEEFQNDDYMIKQKSGAGDDDCGQVYKSHIEIPTNELGLGASKDPIPVIGYYKNNILSYVAPEVLSGQLHTEEKSTIYSLGVLMWELAINKPPYYDKSSYSRSPSHNNNSRSLLKSIVNSNLRPTVSENNRYMMPECYIELMKRCWSSDPKARPTLNELAKSFEDWRSNKKDFVEFERSEKIRIKIMKHKGYDTTPDKLVEPTKIHPQAIYASRKLKFPILPPSQQCKSSSGYVKTTGEAGAGGRTIESQQQSNTIDLESLLTRDQSYFAKKNTFYPKSNHILVK